MQRRNWKVRSAWTYLALCAAVLASIILVLKPEGAAGLVLKDIEADINLDRLVAHGDLIFEGTLSEIRYRLTDKRTPDQPQVPYTFVTYQIEMVHKGTFAQPTITLVFIGGPAGPEGRMLRMHDAPLFSVGQRDLLFVNGNGHLLCPLAGCARGRFRIVDGRVYTESGNAVVRNTNGELTAGPPVLGEDVVRTTFPPPPESDLAEARERLERERKSLSEKEYRKRLERLEGAVDGWVLTWRREPSALQDAESLPLDQFRRAIRERLGETTPSEGDTVRSIDFDTPLYPKAVRPAPFDVHVRVPPAEQGRDPEYLRYLRNGRNPVLPPHGPSSTPPPR
jgi:hypothetical protein